MYLYCANNPVNLCDPTGCTPMDAVFYMRNNPQPKLIAGNIDSIIAYKKWGDGLMAAYNRPASQTQLVIAQTIYGEGGGRYEFSDWKAGQAAVATVILNRVASSKFPDTMDAVCMQSAQFNGYSDGKRAYEKGTCDAIMWDNAMLLSGWMVNGGSIMHGSMTSDYLYFHSAKYGDADTRARIKAKSETLTYGGNMFYINWP